MEPSFAVQLDYLVHRVTHYGWNIGPRTINNFELVLVTAGEGRIAWDDRTFTARAGDFICFVPGVRHRLWVDGAPCMEFYGLHFTPLGGFEPPALPRFVSLSSPHRLQPLFRQLLEDYRDPPYLYKWKQDLLVQQILYEAAVQVHQADCPAEALRIQKVVQQIRQDPCRAVSLDELCAAAHLKKSAFLEAFRRVTGASPGQYRMQLRLERARDLLLDTDLPVAQVAAACGFSDPFYFSRCFSRHFSVSPSRWRAEHL